MDCLKFQPFYDDIANFLIVPLLGKILISVALGALFIVPHYLVSPDLFDNTSILLGMIISVAMLGLYFATHVMRAILPNMARYIKGDCHLFMKPIEILLSTKNLILCGLVFAILNCFVAYSFGIPKISLVNEPGFLAYAVTLYWGYFLAGFVCGMAVQGIITVSYSLGVFGANVGESLDYTSPDNCGGMLFIGNALMIFGSVTLFVGIFISLYILKTDWGEPGESVQMIKIIWVVFPYLMSFIVFVAPAITLNKSLIQYKNDQDHELQIKLYEIKNNFDGDAGTDNDELYKQYQFNQEMRQKLHKMRSWPYGFNANFKFLSVVVVNTFAFYQSAESEFDKILDLSSFWVLGL